MKSRGGRRTGAIEARQSIIDGYLHGVPRGFLVLYPERPSPLSRRPKMIGGHDILEYGPILEGDDMIILLNIHSFWRKAIYQRATEDEPREIGPMERPGTEFFVYQERWVYETVKERGIIPEVECGVINVLLDRAKSPDEEDCTTFVVDHAGSTTAQIIDTVIQGLRVRRGSHGRDVSWPSRGDP